MAVELYANVLQSQPLRPLRSNEQLTNEGGIAFAVDNWTRLTRFLVIGTSDGSFYASGQDLTTENLGVIRECLKEDGVRFVREIVRVSKNGLAVKNEQALLALALASVEGDDLTRAMAFAVLSDVARIGTHLLHFIKYREALGGGWGTGMKRAVGNWFLDKDHDKLAYQMVKYQQRDGWSMRDALRLAHPRPTDETYSAIFDYVVRGEVKIISPEILWGVEEIKNAPGALAAAELIRKYKLPREAVPTQFLNDVVVWDALLEDMPLTALIRNLGKMGSIDFLTPGSHAERRVVEHLSNGERLRKSRVHPIAVLMALKVYDSGRGVRGSLNWYPTEKVVGALNAAFYEAFGNVESTGQRLRLAIDVSGSMEGGYGTILTPREVSAAMALVTARTEPNASFVGFSHQLVELDIQPHWKLDRVLSYLRSVPMGGTIVSLPIGQAIDSRAEYDAFFTYTDSETGEYGSLYGYTYGRADARRGPSAQLLEEYRQKSGIAAKHGVIAAAANGISVADPDDPFQIDICGFSADVPQVIAEFLKLGRGG